MRLDAWVRRAGQRRGVIACDTGSGKPWISGVCVPSSGIGGDHACTCGASMMIAADVPVRLAANGAVGPNAWCGAGAGTHVRACMCERFGARGGRWKVCRGGRLVHWVVVVA